MEEPVKHKATYEDLYSVPENMRGEILNGELIATPRPSRAHGYAASSLQIQVGAPFQSGRGGPGGWILLVEPELGLGGNILVPDLAGWRKERFPVSEETNWISVPPDWICEVLSPDTARHDRITKMNICSANDIGYLWLIDPGDRTLEVFKLESRRWVKLAGFEGGDIVRAEPFQEVEIHLSQLWLER